jgi:O-antigen ligase
LPGFIEPPSASVMQPAPGRRLPRRGTQATAEGAVTLDPLRLAMAAFVILTISNVHMYVRPLAMIRPGLLLWAFIVVYPILVPQSVRWANMTTAWPARVFAALGTLACLSVPFGISIGAAGAYFLDSYIRVLLFGVVLVIGIRSVSDLRTLVWAYVVSMALLIVLAFTVMDVRAAVGGIARLQSETMYDSNDLGVLFMVGMPLALLTFATSRLPGKLLSGFVIVGVPMMVAITGSRGALVGLVALVIAFFVGVRIIPFTRKVLVAGVAVLGITFTAPPGYWDQMKTIIEPGDDYNLTSEAGRKQTAQRGFGYMMKYPVFGVGVGSFGVAEASISPLLKNIRPGDRVYVLAPHNTYVQVGAELGLGALILWCGMLVGGVVSLARLKRRLPVSWQQGSPDRRFLFYATVFMPLSFIGFAVPTTFVSHAYLPSIYLLLACLAAILVHARDLLRQDCADPAPARRAQRGAAAPA